MFPSGPYISTPGSDVLFTCIHSSPLNVIDVVWLVNQTQLSLEIATLWNVEQIFSTNTGIGVLQVFNISQDFNHTLIECEALLRSERVLSLNDAFILLLHGKSLI